MGLYLVGSISLLSAAILVLLAFTLFAKNRGKQMPPGPPAHFLFGNALQLPKDQPWLQLADWSHTYGDTIFIRVLRRPFVILSSFEAVENLLEKRSAIYSQRPVRNMAQLSGFGKALLFQNDGDVIRQTRKLMHSELNPRGVVNHRALQEDEARRMAYRFLDGQITLIGNLRLTAAATLLKITYGYHIESVQDPLLVLAESVMNNLADVITPNKFLVDALPALNYLPGWFPGCGFQSLAKGWKNTIETFMEMPFKGVVNKMRNGTALSSFTSNLLENHLETMSERDLDILKWTSGGIFAAGSDTTISVLTSFFLAMRLHPEVQRKAQEELDRVVGHDILPSFLDREQLPYVEAIIQEVFRWNPAAPLVSRSTAIDDEYKGFHIPARAVVTINVWAMTHDETLYPNSMAFDPDRFLHGTSEKAVPPDPRPLIFGFGRRSCPGVHIADALVYIIIATTLAVFRIEPELDDQGKPIVPIVEYSTGAVSHPAPFKCRVVPRSENAAKLVRHAVEN